MHKNKKASAVPLERLVSRIFLVRGQKVMLDADLATLYGMTTSADDDEDRTRRATGRVDAPADAGTAHATRCDLLGFSRRGGKRKRAVVCLKTSPPRTRRRTMQTAKQDVKELLDHLPDDSTLEDIHYHLYVLEKIRRGETRAQNEGALTQDAVEARLRKWITK